MSGSGGGNGWDVVPTDSCADLVIDTQLSSPKPEVVAGIQEGEMLEVKLDSAGNSTVVIVLSNEQLAGGLASPEVGRLRECIQKGTQYVAVVTGKNDGQVQVRVKAA